MANINRNLLVIFNTGLLDEKAIKKEQRALAEVLQIADSPFHFCTAHELVDRNRISSNPRKIIKEAKHYRLRAFRFLVNKN